MVGKGKKASKASKKSAYSSLSHLQYIPIILYLILSIFDFRLFSIPERTLLLTGGALTLGVLAWMYKQPVRVSALGIGAHTYLLVGGLAALFRITPLLLLYGSFQDAFLFFILILVYLLISINLKKVIRPKLFALSIILGALLIFIDGILGNVIALLGFLFMICGEVKKKW